ncbi:MAG: 30S ribosomal protein S8 [Deltaproteobacteria bacterium]|nr:30S ribosomal protein S8 [Deltaproteobacteria bacterium]
MVNYPLADMLTQIRNGLKARKLKIKLPASKLTAKVAEILKTEGFIRDFQTVADKKQNILEINLKYARGHTGAIRYLQCVSSPGRRVYIKAHEIAPVRSGLGIGIYTTPRGVLTDKQAAEHKVGGEYLCKVW